jgi:dCMP deaminase
MRTRPSWDEYFIGIRRAISARSTCDRGETGALLVKNKHILATGYAGAPQSLPHCDDVGHKMKSITHENGKVTQHCTRTTHAEANAIAHAARFGVSVEGATLYTKFEPCLECTKLLINAGIKRIVCERKYHSADDSREFLKQAGVSLDVLEDKIEEYPNQ